MKLFRKLNQKFKKFNYIPSLFLYHNFLRPHMALDGKTPAEACGIEVKGNDKWKTIIQNASRK